MPAAQSAPFDTMSLRDYFAAKALAGMLTHHGSGDVPNKSLARSAYLLADAMLAERSKP